MKKNKKRPVAVDEAVDLLMEKLSFCYYAAMNAAIYS